MTFGDFPAKGMDDPASLLIPAGVILDRDLTKIHPVDLNDPAQMQEFVGSFLVRLFGRQEGGAAPL